jgi:hypothetical protein
MGFGRFKKYKTGLRKMIMSFKDNSVSVGVTPPPKTNQKRRVGVGGAGIRKI